MKAITILTVVSIWISCQQSPDLTTEEPETIEDSITIEQRKVIAGIRFGMSEEEVEIERQKIKVTHVFNWHGLDIKYHTIGGYKFSTKRTEAAWGSYEDGKLYDVWLWGEDAEPKDYEKYIPDQANKIYQVISEKYGEPDSHTDLPPKHTFDKNRLQSIYQWDIGTKSIEVSVTYSAHEYVVLVHIYQPGISSAVLDRKLKERRAKKLEEEAQAKEMF